MSRNRSRSAACKPGLSRRSLAVLNRVPAPSTGDSAEGSLATAKVYRPLLSICLIQFSLNNLAQLHRAFSSPLPIRPRRIAELAFSLPPIHLTLPAPAVYSPEPHMPPRCARRIPMGRPQSSVRPTPVRAQRYTRSKLASLCQAIHSPKRRTSAFRLPPGPSRSDGAPSADLLD